MHGIRTSSYPQLILREMNWRGQGLQMGAAQTTVSKDSRHHPFTINSTIVLIFQTVPVTIELPRAF